MTTDRSLQPHQWWRPEAKQEERHAMAFAYVRAIEENQWQLRQRQFRNAYLYTGEAPVGAWRVRWRSAPGWMRPQEPNRHAIIEVVNDTAEAMIGATRARCTVQTDGAEWSARRRAVQRERWLEVESKRVMLDRLRTLKFRDCLWGEIGALYWDDDGEKTRCRLISPMELVVDERACGTNGYTTQMHWVEIKDKDEALAELGDSEDARKAIENATNEFVSHMHTSPEMLLLLRSWKLPTRRRDGTLVPGMMLTYTNAGTIESESGPWTRPKFPISVYRWKDPLTGWYGRSPTSMLAWDQARLNKMRRFIAYCQDLNAAPIRRVHKSDENVQMTNEPGQVIATNRPIEVLTPPIVAPEYYADEERTYRRAFEKIGVSQLSATLKTPSADFATGPAFREYRDYEMGRFQSQVVRFEEDFIEDNEQHLLAQKALAERNGSRSVTWRSRNLTRQIDWSKIDNDEDRYVLSLEPANILSRTPSGREAKATEMARAGIFNRAHILRASGHPDVERIVGLLEAPINDIEAAIENCLDDEFEVPERYQDLELGMEMFQMAYLNAKREGAPQIPTLEGLRRWIRLAEVLVKRKQAAMAPPQPQPQISAPPAPGQQMQQMTPPPMAVGG